MKHTKRTSITTLLSLIGSASLSFSATHTVQQGDTLWRISVMHKVSVASIQQANNLSSNIIELGQVLTIPTKTSKARQKAQTSKTVVNSSPQSKAQRSSVKTHVVKKGENLWRIARDNGTTMEELIKRNGLSSSVIEVGQVITLSGSSTPRSNNDLVEKSKPLEKTLVEKHNTEDTIKPEEVQQFKKKLSRLGALQTFFRLAQRPRLREFEPVILKKEVAQVNEPIEKTIVAKVIPPVEARGLEALSKKQQGIVRQQVLLDRNGMGPGVIDGYEGDFSKTAADLATSHRPGQLEEDTPIIVETTVPAAILHYINPDLPGTGKRPDFTQATADQCLLMYKTPVELLAERYHCSEKLLAKMNPHVDFAHVAVGEKIMVPNVSEFKIEKFMDSAGKAINYRYLRSTRRATRVDVDYIQNRIMVWRNDGSEGAVDELLASFPVTTNIKKGPTTQRTIAYFAPAPSYMRKKTGLKLKPGPNSPVGIVWAKLGDGYGIHGTSDGAGNGYNTSSGCIRLSNWDAAIFVRIVPSKTKVNFITGAEVEKKAEPVDSAPVSMIKQ